MVQRVQRKRHHTKRKARRCSVEEVVPAIESLYLDELKPYGRILRKRLAERTQAAGVQEGDIDIDHLRATCDSCKLLTVEPEEGGEWSTQIVGRTPTFVDVYSTYDSYPKKLWADASVYFKGLDGENIFLPGGRYSCAQALVSRKASFLDGCTLGRVCHIVQLAISQKKILGYLNGAVVPYGRSQSMVKELRAVLQQPYVESTEGTIELPLATWDSARSCIWKILKTAASEQPGTGPGRIPLSNIKRLFRSRFQTELSETVLGHSKLSELLQDVRFADVCHVQLEGHGYIVVQAEGGPDDCTEETCGTEELSQSGSEPQRLKIEVLSVSEDTFPEQGMPQPSPGQRWPGLSPYTLSKDGCVGRMVQHTFIHAPLPPPTPAAGAKCRSSSLPKDMGSDKSAWEAACHILAYLQQPVQQDESEWGALGVESLGRCISTAGVTPIRNVSSDEIQNQTKGTLPSPVGAVVSPPLVDAHGEPLSQRRKRFSLDEPLALDFSGHLSGHFSGHFTMETPTPWLSPSMILQDGSLDRFIKNTFINTKPVPPTPAPGAVRRSRSLPKDLGSDKSAWEATYHALSFLPRPIETFTTQMEAPLSSSAMASPAVITSPYLVPPSPALTATPQYCYNSIQRPMLFPPIQCEIKLADLI